MNTIPRVVPTQTVTCPEDHRMTPLPSGAYHCRTCNARCSYSRRGRLVARDGQLGWYCEACHSLDPRRRTAQIETKG